MCRSCSWGKTPWVFHLRRPDSPSRWPPCGAQLQVPHQRAARIGAARKIHGSRTRLESWRTTRESRPWLGVHWSCWDLDFWLICWMLISVDIVQVVKGKESRDILVQAVVSLKLRSIKSKQTNKLLGSILNSGTPSWVWCRGFLLNHDPIARIISDRRWELQQSRMTMTKKLRDLETFEQHIPAEHLNELNVYRISNP